MAKHKHHKFIQTVMVIMILNMLEHGVAHLCAYIRTRGLHEAYCNQKGFKSIPSDLDPTIESLHMFKNPIREIKRSDMMRYKNLKSFKLIDDDASITIHLNIESNAFVDLHELKLLNLIRVNLSRIGFIILPTTIETLYISFSYLTSSMIDVSKLENLKVVQLTHSRLTEMPTFHKYAPLDRVMLSNNSIDITPVSQIVGYCTLRQYEIDFDIQGEVTTSGRDKCECRRLQEWSRRKNIINAYGPNSRPCPTQEPCNEELIPKKWEQLYDDCVHTRRDPSRGLKEDPPPPPINPNTNSSDPVNVTPEIAKKPMPKILYLVMLLLALIILLTAMCFYFIFHKKQPTESIDYTQQDQDLDEAEEEGDEFD